MTREHEGHSTSKAANEIYYLLNELNPKITRKFIGYCWKRNIRDIADIIKEYQK